jgi:hypothetical protein
MVEPSRAGLLAAASLLGLVLLGVVYASGLLDRGVAVAFVIDAIACAVLVGTASRRRPRSRLAIGAVVGFANILLPALAVALVVVPTAPASCEGRSLCLVDQEGMATLVALYGASAAALTALLSLLAAWFAGRPPASLSSKRHVAD